MDKVGGASRVAPLLVGPESAIFVFLVWDVHPLSVVFKVGGIACSPSATHIPGPGAAVPGAGARSHHCPPC